LIDFARDQLSSGRHNPRFGRVKRPDENALVQKDVFFNGQVPRYRSGAKNGKVEWSQVPPYKVEFSTSIWVLHRILEGLSIWSCSIDVPILCCGKIFSSARYCSEPAISYITVVKLQDLLLSSRESAFKNQHSARGARTAEFSIRHFQSLASNSKF
jgi:hypothetical protein